MQQDIWTWDAGRLRKGMQDGAFSSLELSIEYLKRWSRYNSRLCALISFNPDALALAEAADRARAQGRVRGPLHGIPIVIKDNIDTADAMYTTAGSLALAKHRAREDAHLVNKIRDAGMVLLGKANLSQWANFISESSPNGFSALGGQTRNPYGQSLDAGGSSSGSGAAVAAGLAAVAVGTETQGSILSPASENSLVGIKPTVGLVSRRGIVPISFSQDTAGPMAKTVRDAAELLNVLVGEDPRDAATFGTKSEAASDYTQFLQTQSLAGARLGLAREPFWEKLSAAECRVMEAALKAVRDAGAEVVEELPYPPAEADDGIDVLLHEFAPALDRYLESAESVPLRTLEELIQWNYQHQPQSIPYGQTLFIRSLEKGGMTQSGYFQARTRDLRISRTQGLDRVLQEYRLDAMIFPSACGCGLPAKAGYPSVTVPAGYASDTGRPLGMTFTGCGFSEPRLLALAASFEARRPVRQEPGLEDYGEEGF